jgi:2-dehydro-3-deoxy-D-arabinonate dehydratase
VSSRDIEGENPLYLPQAKVYNGSAAIGPGIVITTADSMSKLPIQLEIRRAGKPIFQGDTNTSQIKRPLQELADYLLKELDFPHGVLLLTGAGIVPPDDFTLQPGDSVHIRVADLQLENPVHP